MINHDDKTNSLSHFMRNSSEAIEELEASGKPLVLTVDGEAKVVVQDAKSYQRLLDTIDLAESIIGIRKGLDAMEKGEVQPAEEAFNEIYKKHGLFHRSNRTR